MIGTLLCIMSVVNAAPLLDRMEAQLIQIQEGPAKIDTQDNEDWLTTALNGIASYVVSKFSNPENINEERKYIKVARSFIEPLVDFSDNANPNDKVANSILHTLKKFLSSLEGEIGGNVVGQKY